MEIECLPRVPKDRCASGKQVAGCGRGNHSVSNSSRAEWFGMGKEAVTRKRESILFASLARFAEKRFHRQDLEPGKPYKVSAEVIATVGRAKIETNVSGKLHVGAPYETRRSVAAPAEQIVAALLSQIPASKRVTLLKQLQGQFQKDGTFPVTTKTQVEEAKVWLDSLRTKRPMTRAGAIAFSSD